MDLLGNKPKDTNTPYCWGNPTKHDQLAECGQCELYFSCKDEAVEEQKRDACFGVDFDEYDPACKSCIAQTFCKQKILEKNMEMPLSGHLNKPNTNNHTQQTQPNKPILLPASLPTNQNITTSLPTAAKDWISQGNNTGKRLGRFVFVSVLIAAATAATYAIHTFFKETDNWLPEALNWVDDLLNND